MSLDSLLSQAATDGKLLDAAKKNIEALFAGSNNPVYRASVEELAQGGQWSELNDRFFQSLKFGTGGLRGRTIGRSVTQAERGKAGAEERPEFACVGTNAMNEYNVSRATQGLANYCIKYRKNAGLIGRP